MFELHPQLQQDCVTVGRFTLCRLLLLRDANYPWFILVPERPALREIHHLSDADQQQLLRESSALAGAMEQAFKPDKLNVAALGNMVPQLHIHHIARYMNDPAWPAPVWGRVAAKAYTPDRLAHTMDSLLAALPVEPPFTRDA